MSTSHALPADIGKIAEPLLLGHLLNWALYGALSVQVYVYHLAFPNDPLQSKILVYAVYAAELVQSILLAKKFYQEFAAGFGSFEAIDTSGLLWITVPIISSIVAAVVQIFYAYRVRMLADAYVIPVIIVLLALVGLGGGIALGVIGKEVGFFSKFLIRKTLVATGIWNGGTALCDLLIAISMTYYLSQRSTVWKPTQRIVQRLTRLILETGTLTATLAIVNLAMYLIPGHPTYFQTTSIVLGKLYSNTMMVVLNSRISISHNENSLTELSWRISTQKPTFSNSQGGISVTHEHWTNPLELEDYKGTKGHSDLDTFHAEAEVANNSTVNHIIYSSM